MPSGANQVKAIFLAALEEHAPPEWAAFLDSACAGDTGLRQRVEALLQAHQEATGSGQVPGPAGPAVATTIGPYRLLRQIGVGGMGTVFLAEQTWPVQRTVALKVIRPGLDGGQVVARFEAERQALALMDHPNIAMVFDAGATAEGLPYFVMEHVEGVPLTSYCDEHHFSARQRLELFIPVCQAVQHAHQKGIIHRDLKPSNILVADYDGRPVPKVIDFGIAKATARKLTERTLWTEVGAVVGTLEYMSPEQAGLNPQDIDTRSDVYSLGVLLYELLTGTTPLDRGRLEGLGVMEVLQLIREEEPQRPSTRLSTTAELPGIAARRGVVASKLSGLVRDELDWIALKCLEKDRGRRYDSATALAQDLQRYLNGEVVQACPPSSVYRLRKFVRRHRGPVLAAAGVFLTLLLGIVGTGWALVWATEEQGRAQQEARDRKEAEKKALTDRDTARDALRDKAAAYDAARKDLYQRNLLLADLRWWANRVPESERLLAECPDDLRGWEWHYLLRRCRTGCLVFPKALSPNQGISPLLLFSADARLLVTVATDPKRIAPQLTDNVVTVRDGRTWEILRSWPEPCHVQSVAWHAGRGLLAVRDPKGVVRVKDARTGDTLGQFQPAGKKALALAFHPEGELLAVSDDAGRRQSQIKVWDFRNNRVVTTLPVAAGEDVDLRYRADGKELLTVRADISVIRVQLCDAQTGKVRLETVLPQQQRFQLGASTGEELLALPKSKDEVLLWDTRDGAVRNRISIGSWGKGENLALSPDGTRLVTGGMDGLVRVRDVRSGAELLALRGHRGIVMGVAFHPDGDRALSLGRDGALRVWELQAQQAVWVRPAFPLGTQHVPSLEGNHWVLSRDDGTSVSVRIQDWRTGRDLGQPISLPKVAGRHPWQLKLNPDATRLITSLQIEQPVPEWRCQLWDARTGELLTSWTSTEVSPDSVGYSADFRFLAVVRPDAGLCLVEVTGGGQQVPLPEWKGANGRAVFSPNGAFLAFRDRLGKVFISNLRSQTSVALPIPGRSLAWAFSPDGSRVAVSVADAIELWDTTTCRRLQSLPLAKEASDLLGVAFHPGGRRLAAINRKGEIKVWDTEEGREFPELQFPFSPGGQDGALQLCFAGDRLIAWTNRGRVAVWDGTPLAAAQP